MRRKAAIIFFFMALMSSFAKAVRSMPDDNLAYPVFIQLHDGSTGSGFFLNSDKAIYLVTARHVLFEAHKAEARVSDPVLLSDMGTLTSASKDPASEEKNIFQVDLKKLQKAGKIISVIREDAAVVQFGSLQNPNQEGARLMLVDGVKQMKHAKAGIVGVGPETLKKLEDVLIANEAFVFGYPTSIGLKERPQFDSSKPLLAKGIVSQKNLNQKSIILNCPVFPGNSGGPVVEVEHTTLGQMKFSVIGLITEFVPYVDVWESKQHGSTNVSIANSGYSVAMSIDVVLDLIKKF